MVKLEGGIGDSVRPKNKFETQGDVYKTVERPAMMYGAETWAVKKAQENKLDVDEMRMLKLTFMHYPAIHTNCIIAHCTSLQYTHNI